MEYKDLGNYYGFGAPRPTRLWECQECGAAITDCNAHDAWHTQVEQAHVWSRPLK